MSKLQGGFYLLSLGTPTRLGFLRHTLCPDFNDPTPTSFFLFPAGIKWTNHACMGLAGVYGFCAAGAGDYLKFQWIRPFQCTRGLQLSISITSFQQLYQILYTDIRARHIRKRIMIIEMMHDATAHVPTFADISTTSSSSSSEGPWLCFITGKSHDSYRYKGISSIGIASHRLSNGTAAVTMNEVSTDGSFTSTSCPGYKMWHCIKSSHCKWIGPLHCSGKIRSTPGGKPQLRSKAWSKHALRGRLSPNNIQHADLSHFISFNNLLLEYMTCSWVVRGD